MKDTVIIYGICISIVKCVERERENKRIHPLDCLCSSKCSDSGADPSLLLRRPGAALVTTYFIKLFKSLVNYD